MQEDGASAETAWAWAAAALVAAGAAFGWLDLSLWHPGVDAWDQVKVVALAQEAREGFVLPWRFGGGTPYLHALRAALAWGGPHPALWRLPNLLAYAAESLLLWRLVRRAAGAPAAFGALLLNSAAAFSWLRLRSLLGFVFVPAELLLLLWLAEGRGRWRSLALGLGLGAMLFQYEAAVLALPVAALWGWSRPREQRPDLGWALLGCALLLPALYLGSRDSAANYAAVRLAAESGRGLGTLIGDGLRELGRFITGRGRPDLLLESLPALPLWSLPLLGLGLVQAWRRPGLLAWLALGLAPLAARAHVAEAQRAILAWPALCAFAGLGFSSAWRLLRSRAARTALGLALALGAAAEGAAYRGMQDRVEPLARGHWRLMEAAAGVLRSRPRPSHVLTEIGRRSVSELRALVSLDPRSEEAWVFLPRDYALTRDPGLGEWIPVRDPLGERSAWLLRPKPRAWGDFDACESVLAAYRSPWLRRFDGPGLLNSIPRSLRMPLVAQRPLVRQALVDTYVYTAIDGDQPPSAWLPFLLAQPQLSSTQASMAAAVLAPQDPRRALKLAQGSQALDPRPQTQALIQQIQTRLQAQP